MKNKYRKSLNNFCIVSLLQLIPRNTGTKFLLADIYEKTKKITCFFIILL